MRARLAAVVGLCVSVAALGGRADTAFEQQAVSDGRPGVASRALVPQPAQLAAAPPGLIGRLAADPFNYFRFLNVPWAQHVCEAFKDDLPRLPAVRLHGDAHVEQYAFTSAARGLDDFDDSALGPSVIDLVRFLGSIELAVRSRGWQASETHLFDRFLDGYRDGVGHEDHLPPEPAVVRRLRPTRTRSAAAFLSWAESLMEPAPAKDLASVNASLARLEKLVRAGKPALPSGYFAVKKAGWLRTGVGSALARKALARVEGPSTRPDDDVILEGKQLSDLRAVPCLSVPKAGEVFRVTTGIEQVGRLHHEILAVMPPPAVFKPDTSDWWVRSWDQSYVEVSLGDYASVKELAEVVYDAGAQLGAGGLREVQPEVERQRRQVERDALARLEWKIRSTAHQLVGELLAEWQRFRHHRPETERPGAERHIDRP